MKQIRLFLLSVLCALIALPAMAQESKGIQFFKGTFAEAMAKAKAETPLCRFLCRLVWPLQEDGEADIHAPRGG